MKIKARSEFSKIKQIARAGVRLHGEAYKSDRLVYLGIIIVTLFTALIPYVSNYVSGSIVDQLVAITSNNVNADILYNLIAVFIILLVVERVVGSLYGYFDTAQWIKLYNYFSVKSAVVTSGFDVEHYENSEYNDIIKKANESFSGRLVNFLSRSTGLLSDIVSIFAGFFIIFLVSPILFVIILLTSFPDFVLDLFFGKTKYGVWDEDTGVRRDYWDTQMYLSSDRYLKELKIFGSRNYLLNRMKKLLYGFQGRQLNLELKRFYASSGMSLISGVGFGLMYIVLIKQVLDQSITLGNFTFYVASVRALSNSISSFLRSLSRLYENGLYTIDFYKMLDFKPLLKSGRISAKYTKPPKIEFKDVEFKYSNTNKNIFSGLNITIEPGEHIAIVGENGAGKTTFLSLLSRFYDTTKGQVLINGVNIKNLKQNDWHKNIALLSQDFARYHFDAKTNIGIGDIEKMRDMKSIKNSAKASGADSFISKLDNKYNQVLNRRYPKGVDLSTGQWQKVALARAFFKNSPILILDEPTSAIDPKAEYEIFQKLFDFAKDKTVIIISHRFSTVRNADRIIVMDGGKIVEEGSHKQLIEKGGLYKEAYDLQKKGYEDI